MRPRLLLSLLGLAAALGLTVATGAAPGPSTGAAPAADADFALPFRTTDGALALANLDVQIAGLERRGARLPARARARLVDLLSARAQFTGSVADRERALAIAEALVSAQPNDPALYLARARGRAGLHHFAEALADVESAARLGAPPATVAAARAGVLQGLGRYDEALALRQAAAAAAPTADTLGALAALQAERGEVEAAAATFARARDAYRDVSPFTVAWLLFDEGLMWMHHDRPERARALFAEAHRRLPGYGAAACHLAEVEAELGNASAAVGLLEPLAARSEDPDPAAQLARILAARGDAAGARHWGEHARQRYETLLSRHPDAFADHGAEFYLAAGADPQRGLALAEHNLAVRQTAGAYALLLEAAEAAGRRDMACGIRHQLGTASTPALRAEGKRAAALCG
jgi:tetratricopeptide (TPR) repeat protein